LAEITIRDFHSFYGNAFAEEYPCPINERGALCRAIQIRPNLKWKVQLYFDLFRFSLARLSSLLPFFGQEWLTRISYQPTEICLPFSIRKKKRIETSRLLVVNRIGLPFWPDEQNKWTDKPWNIKVSKALFHSLTLFYSVR